MDFSFWQVGLDIVFQRQAGENHVEVAVETI
jgi:hypothetical protein